MADCYGGSKLAEIGHNGVDLRTDVQFGQHSILIFWCLLAFIACGFEHSVANMTAFSVALLGDHPSTISLYRMGYNLLWVTLGNIVGGALFMGTGYWAATPSEGYGTTEISTEKSGIALEVESFSQESARN